MSERVGHIVSLTQKTAGDEVIGTHLAGNSVLFVGDIADFAEEGGVVAFPDHEVGGVAPQAAYTAIDEDFNSITLAAPLALSLDDGDRVQEWDIDNNRPVSEYVAMVAVDGDEDGDPAPVVLAPGQVATIAQAIKGSGGEAVTIVRDGGRLALKTVHGKAADHEAMTLLKGGFTTREDVSQTGVEITADGILAFDSTGAETVRIDSQTGDATFIGEIGTAPPGEVGLFGFSTKFSGAGVQVTNPTLQFNVGATGAQPSVHASTVTQSGLFISSGYNTADRQTLGIYDSNLVKAWVESSAGSGSIGSFYQLTNTEFRAETNGGAQLFIDEDDIHLSDGHTSGLSAVLDGTASVYTAGYKDVSSGNVQGVVVLPGTATKIQGAGGAIYITAPNGTTYADVNASAFNISSDSTMKTDVVEAPDALAIILAAPAMQWRYDTDPEGTVRIGPMADDMPADLVQSTPSLTEGGAPTLTVDLARMSGLHHRAIEQLAAENQALKTQLSDLSARLDQLENKGA